MAEATKTRRQGAPAWLMTFADLMALLFALFVLILSFSEVDSDSFKKNAGPMAAAFNQAVPTFVPPVDAPPPKQIWKFPNHQTRGRKYLRPMIHIFEKSRATR